MARPLKYGEKTSVRSVTMPDSMWEALPEPKSQWTVEAVRQFLAPQRDRALDASPEGAPMPKEALAELTEKVKASTAALEPIEMTPDAVQALVQTLPEPIRSEVPDPLCDHPKARQVNVIGGKKCLTCGKVKKLNGTWA